MDNKSSYIKERILQIAEYKGIAKEKFIENLGQTYGNFKSKSKLTPVNSNFLEDLLSKYPEINPEWLITGNGEMLKETNIDLITPEKRFDNALSEYVSVNKEQHSLLMENIELLQKMNNLLEEKVQKLEAEITQLKKEKSVKSDISVVESSKKLT